MFELKKIGFDPDKAYDDIVRHKKYLNKLMTCEIREFSTKIRGIRSVSFNVTQKCV